MFAEFINEEYVTKLKEAGIETPTEIQLKAMPVIFEGKDVIGLSKTGSGKTLAYLLPVLSKLDPEIKSPQILVLTPTHELAHQVYKVCSVLMDKNDAALLIGGANMNRQIEALKQKPKIVIGSAGRVLELNKLKKFSAHYIKTIVIDEADRMLDDKNIEQVKSVIKLTQKDRQLLFFSASFDQQAINTAKTLSNNPEIIEIKGKALLPESIEHYYFVCEKRDKIEVLRKFFHGENIKRGIVFINSPEEIETLAKRLNYHGINALSLHGDFNKIERANVLRKFRQEDKILLVASDIASRGLDIEGLTHVINFDVPENPMFYLHRSGRCGRMGQKGVSILIATKQEVVHIKKLQKKFNVKISEITMKFGVKTII